MFKSPVMVLALALFFTLVGATGYRVMTAIDSDPGLVVADAYKRGAAYGETLAYKKKLKADGWTVLLKTPMPARYDVTQTYRATSEHKSDTIHSADAVLYFYRPLEQAHDFSRVMELDEDGGFQADVHLPLKGRWDVVLEITKANFVQRASAKLFAQ